MARKTFYVTREMKHPLYKTRMLTAGQPLALDAGAAFLYRKLGVGLSEEKPKGRTIPAVDEVLTAEVVEEKPAKPQLDHDGNGKAGGSKAGAQSTRAKGAARKRKAKK